MLGYIKKQFNIKKATMNIWQVFERESARQKDYNLTMRHLKNLLDECGVILSTSEMRQLEKELDDCRMLLPYGDTYQIKFSPFLNLVGVKDPRGGRGDKSTKRQLDPEEFKMEYEDMMEAVRGLEELGFAAQKEGTNPYDAFKIHRSDRRIRFDQVYNALEDNRLGSLGRHFTENFDKMRLIRQFLAYGSDDSDETVDVRLLVEGMQKDLEVATKSD